MSVNNAKAERVPVASWTVGDLIRQVFPNGVGPDDKTVETPPALPFDLFAVSALLLHRSGTSQRIVSTLTNAPYPLGSLKISKAEIRKIKDAAKEWRSLPKPPDYVVALWRHLLTHSQNPIFSTENTEQKWVKIAYTLMAISDEAAADVGYVPANSSPSLDCWVVDYGIELLGSVAIDSDGKKRHAKITNNNQSITSPYVNLDVVCVQPKARTSNVGSSIRNLSHNLALLPPRGIMRVNWITPPCQQGNEDDAALNVLLIPYPYQLDPLWFHAGNAKAKNWHWFSIEQLWLNEEKVVKFVDELVKQAQKSDIIHGVVFPEYAINWKTHQAVAEMLRKNHPGVQFMVSGSSSNCGGEKGNFALATHFFSIPGSGNAQGGERHMMSVSRAKHHRWSLESSQIETYGLHPQFSGNKDSRWWEEIPLSSREIHVNPMRNSSVFSVMICEDLARADPAHEPVRALGPNLMFVLLMDGAQRQSRWAARYSIGLAEDPGTSVLTFTSRGLVALSNDRRPPADVNWSIGIWKDDEHPAEEILCPPGDDAVMIKLIGKRKSEIALDGRINDQTYAWRKFEKHTSVQLCRIIFDDLLKCVGAL